MSDVNNVGGQNVIDQFSLGNNNSPREKKDELGRNEFLKLFIAQLNNQDPLSPQENGEFVAQLAQFSSLEGIENLNKTNEGIAENIGSTQALQASTLVGRAVIVPGSDSSYLREQGLITGYAELPQSTSSLRLTVKDSSGSTIESFDLGYHEAGATTIRWDGANIEMDGEIVDIDLSDLNRKEIYRDEEGNPILDDDGQPIPVPYPPGDYSFELSYTGASQTEGLETLMSSQVQSVTMGPNGSVTLNLYGGNKAALDQVKQVLDA